MEHGFFGPGILVNEKRAERQTIMKTNAVNRKSAGNVYAKPLSLGCNLAVASLIGVMGLVLILTGLVVGRRVDGQLLGRVDVLLGASTRAVVLLAGVLHLAVSACLFIARDPFTRVLVVLWLVSVSVLYRLGLGWMKVGGACPLVTLVAHKVGIIPARMGGYWAALLAGVVLLELLHFGLEWRRQKQLEASSFWTHWKKIREKE